MQCSEACNNMRFQSGGGRRFVPVSVSYSYYLPPYLFLRPKTGPGQRGVRLSPNHAQLGKACRGFYCIIILCYSKNTDTVVESGGCGVGKCLSVLDMLGCDPWRSSWPWPSKVPISEHQPRHKLYCRGRCVSPGIISSRAEILLIRIADAKALNIRDAGRAWRVFYTCFIHCLTRGLGETCTEKKGLTGGFRKCSRKRTPISGKKDPRQRVCPGSVNLDKVGIITDLNDKHLLYINRRLSNNQVIQSLTPIRLMLTCNFRLSLL